MHLGDKRGEVHKQLTEEGSDVDLVVGPLLTAPNAVLERRKRPAAREDERRHMKDQFTLRASRDS